MLKYKSLESLRGMAALIVALFHSGFYVGEKHIIIAQGEIFVDFFFILSGFVMACAYTDKIIGGFSIKSFILLRFGRLYPLHLLILLVWLPYILAKAYGFHQFGMGSDPLIKSNLFTFVSSLFLVNSLGVNDNLSWNYPAWSISVEFFTYIVFFIFVSSFKSNFKVWQLMCVSVLAFSCLFALTDHSLLSTYEFGFFRCIGGFFLGSWLYHVSMKIKVLPTKIQSSLVELVVIAITIFLVLNSAVSKEFQLASILSFGVIILLFAVQEQGIVSDLLKSKFMLMLGTFSYSIYMVHAIVFSVAGNLYQYILKMPIKIIEGPNLEPVKYYETAYADLINLFCVAVIIGISYFTYNYVERPWRDKFRDFAKVPSGTQSLADKKVSKDVA